MAFIQNNLSGSLFRNDRKEQDNHPDYTGSAKIEEVDYWVSGWVKKARSGKKFMSLAFTKKEESQVSTGPGAEDFDDDIPF